MKHIHLVSELGRWQVDCLARSSASARVPEICLASLDRVAALEATLQAGPGSYSLRFRVAAPTLREATDEALARCDEIVERAGLPRFELSSLSVDRAPGADPEETSYERTASRPVTLRSVPG